MRRGSGALLGVLLAAGLAAAPARPKSLLRVTGVQGAVRLFRFETEPWPLDLGAPLPEQARLELGEGALLRLRYHDDVDFAVAGPARLAVYVVPSPDGPAAPGRVVLKLDQGWLFTDGRFQFGRPEDLVLSLPDRDLPLKPGGRFFTLARGGRSVFLVPAGSGAAAAELSGGVVAAAPPAKGAPAPPPVPASLLAEPSRPVPLFVVARDFNQDLGLWPHPAVLGPLLAERMAQVPGIQVVDGSGDTRFSYRSNSALKKGQDDFLKALALAQGARWVLVGNCVTDTPPRGDGGAGRWVRGQAEVRLLDAESEPGSLELVSEAAVTRVARAGRPIEQASRQAFEAASDEVASYMRWQVEDLLRGKAHAEILVKLEVEGANQSSLEALRARLEILDSVQRWFRRRYYGHVADFDLMLRRSPADFAAQWGAAPETGGWTFRSLPGAPAGSLRVRALRAP